MDKAFAVVALGALAWLAGGIYQDISVFEPFMLGLLLIAVGFAGASLFVERSRGLAVGGFGVALLGMIVFLGDGLFQLTNLSRVASHAFSVALIVAGAAVLLRSNARTPILRLGLALGALACVLWIVADLEDPEWQAGNIIAGAGLAWAAWRPTLPE